MTSLRSSWRTVRSVRWLELALVPYVTVMLLRVDRSLRLGSTDDAQATARRWSMRLPLPPAGDDPGGARRLLKVVRAAGRLTPADVTCLRRSIVLAALCGRRGIDADVAVGVRRGDDTEIIAHAWVEIDGVVLGERAAHIATYERLRAL